jgi:hypothetical protein
MPFSKETYENYIHQIDTLLKKGELYPSYGKSINVGKNDFKLTQVFTKKNYSTDWIDMLEDCVNSLDTIVRNPRKFIVVEEDIVDISLARSISVESVKHLAQHTNFISSVTKDGMVIPNKILNTSKEESFEIYENRFVYTLLKRTKDFLDRRFDVIKAALMESGEVGVELNSEFTLEGHKVNFKLEAGANFPFEAAMSTKSEGPSNVERLTRINSIFNDFLSSAFAREMRNSAAVRPPIQRTNVILKDPNFKKALVLWQFVETAENMDFNIETAKETTELPEIHADKYKSLIFLNTVMLQSIAAAREPSDDEGKEFKKKRQTLEDICPDDYPHLKLKLNEVRKVFHDVHIKTLDEREIEKLDMAIDRALRQWEINQEAEDSLRRELLIEEQWKAEEEARRLALEDEKKLEQERIEKEEQRQQQMLLEAEAEAKRKLEEEEQELLRKLEEERLKKEEELKEAARLAAIEYEKQREEYWRMQKELALELLTNQNKELLTQKQTDAFFKLTQETEKKADLVNNFVDRLIKAVQSDSENEKLRLMNDALSYRNYGEIVSIDADYTNRESLNKAIETNPRAKFLRSQLKLKKEQKELKTQPLENFKRRERKNFD